MIKIDLITETKLNEIITNDAVIEKIQVDLYDLELEETLHSGEGDLTRVFTPSPLLTKLTGMINRSGHGERFNHEDARRSRA